MTAQRNSDPDHVGTECHAARIFSPDDVDGVLRNVGASVDSLYGLIRHSSSIYFSMRHIRDPQDQQDIIGDICADALPHIKADSDSGLPTIRNRLAGLANAVTQRHVRVRAAAWELQQLHSGRVAPDPRPLGGGGDGQRQRGAEGRERRRRHRAHRLQTVGLWLHPVRDIVRVSAGGAGADPERAGIPATGSLSEYPATRAEALAVVDVFELSFQEMDRQHPIYAPVVRGIFRGERSSYSRDTRKRACKVFTCVLLENCREAIRRSPGASICLEHLETYLASAKGHHGITGHLATVLANCTAIML